jgi:uncharacterized OB-fold protein
VGFEKFGWVSYASQTRVSEFIDYLQEGKVDGTKCKECGCLQFPPRAHCVRCLSSNFEWKELSGECDLITYTTVDASPATFKGQAPYMLGLAQFSEGPKVFAWIDKAITQKQLTPGMKMKLKASKLSNGNLSYILTLPGNS